MRRCGICRGTGHNRQTCPGGYQKTAAAAPVVQSPVVANSDRTASGRRKGSCSYCRNKLYKIDRTHTCRICPTRKADLANWIDTNKTWAKEYKAKAMRLGVGIGSLIEYGESVYEVERIDFNEISCSTINGYFGKNLANPEKNNRFSMRLWIMGADDDTNVVSPITPNVVSAQFPKDWESGKYGVPYRLRDPYRKSRKK